MFVFPDMHRTMAEPGEREFVLRIGEFGSLLSASFECYISLLFANMEKSIS